MRFTTFNYFIKLQIAFMKYKATEIVQMAPVLYAIITFLGNSVQFVVLHVHKSDIKRLLVKLERTATKSMYFSCKKCVNLIL